MAANIISNFFKLNYEDDSNFIKDKDFVNLPENNIEDKPYIHKGYEFLQSLNKILHSCKGYENISFKEIHVDHRNFKDYHYEIMRHERLIVLYDNKTLSYKYITPTGIVFIISDKKVIEIIHNLPFPRKITFSYVPLIDDEKIISICLLSKLFYNINTEDPSSLIKEYLKPNIEIDASDEYSLMYYLFNIYGRLEFEINKFHYWKYIYSEQYLYNVSKKDIRYDLLDIEMLSYIKNSSFKELNIILKDMNITKEVLSVNKNILNSMKALNTLYPTLNKEIAESLSLDNITKLINLNSTISLYNSLEKNKKLPRVNIVSQNGTLDNGIDINSNFSKRTLIRGSYPDLFYKILSDVTHRNDFIQICSTEVSLVNELLKNSNINNLNFNSCIVKNYIKAIILGFTSDEDIINYFKVELNTFISEDDLINAKNIYKENLIKLKNTIDKFNSDNYKNSDPKLIFKSNISPIGIAILDKIRLIESSLIQEINLYCKDFNKQNKSQIDIVYFNNEYIYLLCDEEASNTAFDTLTRIMPSIISKICPKISPTCYVEIVSKPNI